MALNDPAYVASSEATNLGSASLASGSCTPTAGARVFVVVGNTLGSGTAGLPTLGSGTGWASGLSWTQTQTQLVAGNTSRITVLTSVVGSSPTAGTITATMGEAQTGIALHILEQTAGAVVTVVQSAGNAGSGTAFSATLSAAPVGCVIAMLYHTPGSTETYTPGTGYTALRQTNNNNQVHVYSEFDNPGPGDGVADASATTSALWAMIAIETTETGSIGSLAGYGGLAGPGGLAGRGGGLAG